MYLAWKNLGEHVSLVFKLMLLRPMSIANLSWQLTISPDMSAYFLGGLKGGGASMLLSIFRSMQSKQFPTVRFETCMWGLEGPSPSFSQLSIFVLDFSKSSFYWMPEMKTEGIIVT